MPQDFLHEDRLFPSDPTDRAVARRLFETIAELPNISPHGHTDPAWFARKAPKISGIAAEAKHDPTSLPFDRAHLSFTKSATSLSAEQIAASLKSGEPSIWTMEHLVHQSEIVFELVQLSHEEVDTILDRLTDLMKTGDTA